jgi:hypothetical protein
MLNYNHFTRTNVKYIYKPFTHTPPPEIKNDTMKFASRQNMQDVDL